MTTSLIFEAIGWICLVGFFVWAIAEGCCNTTDWVEKGEDWTA